MIIRIFCDYATTNNIFQSYVRIFNLQDDPLYNNKYIFTTEDDYTHAFILNTATPVLTIPKENVIGFAHEPLPFLNITPRFIEYAKTHIHKYLIGDATNLPEPFIQHHGFMGHIAVPKSLTQKKSKIASIIISKKYILFGHKYRHKLVQAILRTNYPIDIYGRGVDLYSNINDPRIKTEFNNTEPYDDYLFHIAIENIQHPNYVSEKVIDPLICGTNVIYWGATNVKSVLSSQPIHILTGDIQRDIHKIYIICQNAEKIYIPPNLKQLDDIHITKSFKFFGTKI
jgi:hypothetical protein